MTTDPDGKPYAHNEEQSEAAKATLKAWDELTDTTHPRAFGRMKDAMEKLRDAVQDHEADEIGRVVDAMTPEQVNAFLESMGVDLDDLHKRTQEMRAKIERRMTLPTTQPTHSDIAWYVRELTEAKAREAKMLDALRLVAKHADFSQCPDGVEEAVDEIMAQHLREGGSPCS